MPKWAWEIAGWKHIDFFTFFSSYYVSYPFSNIYMHKYNWLCINYFKPVNILSLNFRLLYIAVILLPKICSRFITISILF
jgi:hypothetical protein